MLGEPLVDERVVGAHEVEDAAVPAYLVGDEELGLAPERLAQVVVPLGIQLGGRDHARQRAEGQPLEGEAVDEGVGAGVGEHAPHLRLEHVRIAQLPAAGRVK